MCSLQSNSTADEGFKKLRRMGQPAYEDKLARLADEDTIEQENSLGVLAPRVRQWQSIDGLKEVRKYGIGRHRAFIVGHHSKCTYRVIYVMVCKKKEDDKPNDKNYKLMILNALKDNAPLRIVEPPNKEDTEEQIGLKERQNDARGEQPDAT